MTVSQKSIKHAARLFLGNEQHYYSASKDELMLIADMHRTHAANAAERLLADAETWMLDAGVYAARPKLWMTTQPVFVALVKRAGL